MFRRIVALVSLFLAGTAGSATLHDPSIEWKSLHSQHFIVHFPPALKQKAAEVAYFSELIHNQLSVFFDWSTKQKTEITLTENALTPGAYASEQPINRIQLHLQANFGAEQGYAELARLIAHEYTHILHLDKVAGVPAVGRTLFGRLNYLFPNLHQPLWGIEGLASYASDYLVPPMSSGEDHYFSALMRWEVYNGIKPLSQINIALNEWPFVIAPYLYGEEFYRFLAEQHGKDSVSKLVANYSDNLLPYFINSNAKSVYEKDLGALYEEFKSYLHQRYDPQIQRIQAMAYPKDTELRGQFSSSGSPVAANGHIYFLSSDQLSHNRLVRVNPDNGHSQTLFELPAASLLDGYHSQLLLIKRDWKRNTINTRDLYRLDLNSGKQTQLTDNGYYLYARWNRDATQIIAQRYQHDRYWIDLLDAQGHLIKHVWQSQAGEKISGLDWSVNGKRLLLSVWRRNQFWQLEELNLQTLDANHSENSSWHRLLLTSSAVYNAHYARDDQEVLFTSDIDGVPNLYRMRLSDKKLFQLTAVIGSVGSGYWLNGRIYYTRMAKQGFKIFQLRDSKGRVIDLAESNPAVTQSNPFLNSDLTNYTITEYSPYSGLMPRQFSPRINSSNKLKLIGFKTYGRDALRRHYYALQMDHISTISQNQYLFNYRYDRWYPTFDYKFESELSLGHDNAGNLTSITQIDTHALDMIVPVLKQLHRWAGYVGLRTETVNQRDANGGASLTGELRDDRYGLAMLYDSSQAFTRSVALSDGRSLLVSAEQSAPSSDHSGRRYKLEWREYAHLGGAHVLSARIALGRASQSMRQFSLGGEVEPVNMHFSASALEQVLPSSSPFDNRRFALRGYAGGIPDLVGPNMQLLSLDWKFPLWRVHRTIMAPPIGVGDIVADVFYDRGDAWQDSRHYLSGYGMELRLGMRIFYKQNATWRFGIARGTADFAETRLYHYIHIPL